MPSQTAACHKIMAQIDKAAEKVHERIEEIGTQLSLMGFKYGDDYEGMSDLGYLLHDEDTMWHVVDMHLQIIRHEVEEFLDAG